MSEIYIKKFENKDLREVVDLFSLVWELDVKNTEAKTKWAFIEGTKLCLLAKDENGKIVGVRGGFSWPLIFEKQVMPVYQFHGTCVHPDFRRRGIFKKLNISFIEEAEKEKIKAIFNVSVMKSRMGYEKLGWKYLKTFRRLTLFNKPFQIINNLKSLKQPSIIDTNFNSEELEIDDILLKKREEVFFDYIHTKYSQEFLSWRLNNKEAGYIHLKTQGGSIIYKRLKKGIISEIIIGEVFLREYNKKNFKLVIRELLKKEKPTLVCTYIHQNHPCYNYYLTSLFLPNPLQYNLHFGTKCITQENDFLNDYYNKNNWALSFMDIDTF